MKKKLIGLFACVAMVGAGSALANNEEQLGSKQPKNQDISGSSTSGSMGAGSMSTGSTSSSGTSVGSTGSSVDSSMSGTGGSGTSGMGTSATGSMGASDKMQNDKMQNDKMQKGSMDMGQMGNELTGRVVRSNAKTVYVNHMGFIVPLAVNSQTRFEGPDLKSLRDVKEGQEIRANFTIKNGTQNVATTIMAGDTGHGGSGILQDESLKNPGDQQPSTGGSGMENRGDLDQNQNGSLGGRSDQMNQDSINDRTNLPSNRTMNPGPLNNNQGNSTTPDCGY